MSKVRGHKRSLKSWYKELDTLFSKLITSKGECDWCGSTWNSFQCAHVIGRRNKTLRWDPMNAMCLDGACHMWKWHESPLEAEKWFKGKYPDRYEYLMRTKDILVNRTDADLQEIKDKILAKDIKGLMMGVDKL